MRLPKNCINLYSPSGWRNIRSFINRTASSFELATAVDTPADRMFEDDLESVLPSFSRLLFDLCVYLETRNYSFLGIHCCRPLSLAGYYETGFQPLSEGRVRQLIREYGGEGFTDDDAAVCLTALDLGCRRDLVMFSAGYPEDVDDHSKHYLLIGPEFLCEIANAITVAAELKQKFSDGMERSLANSIPTVFVVAVPFKSMSEAGRIGVATQLIAGHLWLRSTQPKRSKDWCRDMSLVCDMPVPPSAIIGHTHPVEIPNFFSGRKVISKGHATRCGFCKPLSGSLALSDPAL